MKNLIISMVLLSLSLFSGCAGSNREREENLRFLEQNMGNADPDFLSGKSCLSKKEFDKALILFEKSSFGLAKFYKALTLGELNKKSEAKAIFEECVSENILKAESLYNLAMISYDLGKMENAKTYALEAIKVDPKHIASLFFYGNLNYIEKNMPVALEYYKKALKIDPKIKDFWDAVFFVYLNVENYAEAWKIRENLNKNDPEIVKTVLQTAEITGNFLDGVRYIPKEFYANREIKKMARILLTKGGRFAEAYRLALEDLKSESDFVTLDRSTDSKNAFVLGLNKNFLFLACAKDRENPIPIEVLENGIKISGKEGVVLEAEISTSLKDFCAQK